MAEVGVVFSEINARVIPEYCFHIPSPAEATDVPAPPPHPATPSSEAPASPVPAAFRKLRRVSNLPGVLDPPDERLSCPSGTIILLPSACRKVAC